MNLSHALASVMGEEFSVTMCRFAHAFPAYRERLPRIPFAYSRTRLAATMEYEIVAMNWAPQSSSPIHDHGSSRCWVLMLDGTLDVQNYACDAEDVGTDGPPNIRQTEHLTLRKGDVDHRLGPAELHRVRNLDSSESAFSLQLYAAPLVRYTIVDDHSKQRRIATATFDLELVLEASADSV